MTTLTRTASVVAAALPLAWRVQCSVVDGARAVENDGLLLAATGILDPSVNPCLVDREPAAPDAAVAAVESTRTELGLPGHGFDLPEGAYPRLESTLRARGWTELLRRPAMAVPVDELRRREAPADVDMERVTTHRQLAAYRAVQTSVFGFSTDDAARWAPEAALGHPDLTMHVAYDQRGAPLAAALGYLAAGTVGVFAVGTVEGARGRGIGTALTTAVVDEAAWRGAKLAWLQATELGQPVYAAMGFAEVAQHVVHERATAPTP